MSEMTAAYRAQQELDRQQEHLQEIARGRECRLCSNRVEVVWHENTYKLRCGCWPNQPTLYRPNEAEKTYGKRWEDMRTAMERYPDQKVIANIRKEDIVTWIAPKASETEVEIFLRFCIAQGLNPFAQEVYLIPFKQRHVIVVGIQAYLKRASRNPLYQSFVSGLIVKRGKVDKVLVDLTGTFTEDGDEIVGGWCKVYKKGAPVPFEERVRLDTWNKRENVWASNPATMIEVTAIRHAVRRAFPESEGPYPLPEQVEGMFVEVGDPALMAPEPPPAAQEHPATARQAPEPPVEPRPSAEGPSGASQRVPEAERVPTTLPQLWNWGLKHGYPGGKPEMLKALGLANDSLIADVGEAQEKLKAARPGPGASDTLEV